MSTQPASFPQIGISIDPKNWNSSLSVQMFGHVTLVQGYALPTYVGCHALVALRDTPGTMVAVLTTASNLQGLLETALVAGNLVAFRGEKLSDPPTPLGGTWSVDVYEISSVILYNMK